MTKIKTVWVFWRYRTAVLEEEVVGVMAEHHALTRQAQAEQLLRWEYDNTTATYFLLLARRQAGKEFRILQPFPDLKPLPDLIADKVPVPFHTFYTQGLQRHGNYQLVIPVMFGGGKKGVEITQDAFIFDML